MTNDIYNNVEFAKQATERYNFILNMIENYVKEFDVIEFRLTYNKEKNKEVKFGGFVEYNLIYP